MGTREYPWVSKYPWITRIESMDTGTGTGTIIIQWGGDGYHTTRSHGYPLTSLLPTKLSKIPLHDLSHTTYVS